jgi:hypothetical protein
MDSRVRREGHMDSFVVMSLYNIRLPLGRHAREYPGCEG